MILLRDRGSYCSYLFLWACLAIGFLNSCTDGYDLADKSPDWLGSSIYDYLQESGNYTNVIRLIDDLGYRDVLAKTGSKTLFVADDDAYARFYAKRELWDVGSYEGLSTAQKKQLLYGSMIDNACQVAYLSSSEGPTEGDCMRRLTSSSEYDSVPILYPDDMPDNLYWEYYKKSGKIIPCLQDATTAPMVHFIEDFLNNKKITNEDCNFLFNYETERHAGDAHVNGVLMEEQNIRCSNGFVHKMADVITTLPNMADRIARMPRAQAYSKLLDRFSAPYYSAEATTEYNRLYCTNYDSVFQKRYFSDRSQGGSELSLAPDNSPAPAQLKFDPGWNEYYSEMNAGTSADVALQENMAVMLVPTDEALNKYWNEGSGAVLKDKYGTWDNVPDEVLSKLINVNMLNSFTNSVPSKFSSVYNDANDEMGLTTDAIDSVFMACNGAIYLTNKVYNPVAYISVSFPALVNETMSIIYWAIEQLSFDVYLNSQSSYYSFFIPTNDGLLTYVDPCSFGKTSTQLFRFYYDGDAQTEEEQVWASIWNYDVETGVVGDSIGEATYDQITDRLQDILDYHIVVGNVEDGNTYYQTKGGGVIKVENAGASNMQIMGSWQVEHGLSVGVETIYDQSNEGNGKSYILDGGVMMTSQKSVYDILCEHDEFSAFKELLEGSEYLTTKVTIGTDEHGCPSQNINLFNTFNYTVYVPTNASIEALHTSGDLPTWDEVEAEEDEDVKAEMEEKINLFVKYHIQDNSLYIGQGTIQSTRYETAAYSIDESTNTLSYYKVTANGDNGGITVTDNKGNVRSVITSGGLYNLMAREYQYDSSDAVSASTLYTSSFAVVHQIDGVLWWE